MLVGAWSRVSARDLAIFARQLHTMVQASVPFQTALEGLMRSSKPALAEALQDCCRGISSGRRLSACFRQHEDVFTPMFASMLKVGEETGSLVGQLDRFADLLERQHKMRHKVSSALLYPSFLVGACLLMLATFSLVLLPSLEPFLRSLPVELPAATRALLAFCALTREPLAWLGLAILLWLLLWDLPRRVKQRRQHDDQFARRFDELLWRRMPLIGPAYRNIALAEALSNVATAVEVGMGVMGALQLAAQVAPNRYLAHELEVVCERVRQGETVQQAAAQSRCWGNWVVTLIGVGEESGKFSRTLIYVAALCEQDAFLAIETCVQLVEPLLLTSMGVLAAYLAIATLSPVGLILTTL